MTENQLAEHITIKGWRGGVLIRVATEGSWDEAVTELEAKLAEAKDFWKGAAATLDVAERELTGDELHRALAVLGRFELSPTQAVAHVAAVRELATEQGLTAHEKLPVPEKKEPGAPPPPPHNALYLRQTVRSGQRIEHAGHLVILGDVNAGSEVIAVGDIVVFGTLRGVAHAGAAGDEGARIVATNLRPTQLRIATRIARAPDAGSPPLSKFPEVALVEDGEIHIRPL